MKRQGKKNMKQHPIDNCIESFARGVRNNSGKQTNSSQRSEEGNDSVTQIDYIICSEKIKQTHQYQKFQRNRNIKRLLPRHLKTASRKIQQLQKCKRNTQQEQ